MGFTPDFEKAKDYVLNRLESELSSDLTYHCLEHTVKEVVPTADHLATLEKVADEDRIMLLTGAYYHDLGFIRQRQEHESVSIQLAEETLPMFGYSDTQIAVIKGVIQATCIPQSPTNLLERIMADADLDYLGRENFWKRSQDLRRELENYGEEFTDSGWLIYQMSFIKAHHYFTRSQRSRREAAKQKHLHEIEIQLSRLTIIN